jgi:hypothetical protein
MEKLPLTNTFPAYPTFVIAAGSRVVWPRRAE